MINNKTKVFKIEGLENISINIGKIIEEEETWEEPLGPTPKPDILDLREWDFKLLKRYKPFYAPYTDFCDLCTMGKCDLSQGRRGACGLDITSQTARIVLAACLIGAAAHNTHSRDMLERLIKKFGPDYPIDIGKDAINVEAPLTRLIVGKKPSTLGDLEEVLDYVEKQITYGLSAVHTGQEGSYLDFESKALHAGMLDLLTMEVGDIAQISTFGFPKADPDAPLVEIGMGTVDKEKPVILGIGHNVLPGIGIIDYLIDNGLEDEIELCAICCTAHDMARYYEKTKVIGPITNQQKFIRTGVPDVIIVDEQCVRTVVMEEAEKIKAPVIATTNQICYGLPNRTNDPVDEIVRDLVEGKEPGVLITDPDKVGEVAVKVAKAIAPKRKKFKVIPDVERIKEIASTCTQCERCRRVCPSNLPIHEANEAASKGDLSKLVDLHERCIGCNKCAFECPQGIVPLNLIEGAWHANAKTEKSFVRSGRGPISDVEIRNVGAPIVLGTIPGIIAYVGCSNYPGSRKDLYDMVVEFASRKYIVVSSGCAAMDLSFYKDDEGKTVWERFPGAFDAGNVCNTGSCLSNSHIAGAAIKVANIFAQRNLRANFEEIADYILNRIGAVGVAWGAYSQKAAAIATGFNRLGVPVIVGPHGSKYRRMYLGRKDKKEEWQIIDAKDGSFHYFEPGPEHLIYTAETKEEAIVQTARMVMRPNDTAPGRSIKLTHYLDLSKKYFGEYPEDWYLFVRSETDLPIARRSELLEILEKEHGFEVKDKKIKGGQVRAYDPRFDPTNLERLIRNKKI
ncbi:MAG: CO dehydrogenase/acetyl-CoA synthase complex subunit alpha [Candidatus Hydrothermarchaeota archaeon]